MQGVGDGATVLVFISEEISSALGIGGVIPCVGKEFHNGVGSVGRAGKQGEVVDVVAAVVTVIARSEGIAEGDIVTIAHVG